MPFKKLEQFILERIKQINARADNELEDDIAEVQAEIEDYIEDWRKYARAAKESKLHITSAAGLWLQIRARVWEDC